MPPGHPEQAARWQAACDAVSGIDLAREEAPEAGRDLLALAHTPDHVAAICDAATDGGLVALDGDTFLGPHTAEAARRAVGGACRAVDEVLAAQATNAFVAMRPPGHHAEARRAMGFCLFGTVGIAARHAIAAHGLSRVAIVDFDVHHGNGTQDIVWDESCVLFASSHQMPLFPGTGAAHERGGHDQIVNVPLAPMSGGTEMRRAYTHTILPRLDAFAPQLVLVSAGFDAHGADPLANLDWTTEDFAWLTGEICDLAARHCGGRVVSCLEGGYDLTALARRSAPMSRFWRSAGDDGRQADRGDDLRGGDGCARGGGHPAGSRRGRTGAVDQAVRARRRAEGALRGEAARGRGKGGPDHPRCRRRADRGAAGRGALTVMFEGRLSDAQARINAALDATIDGSIPQGNLQQAMRYACTGGKRLRGFLVLESAALHDADADAALHAAQAVEMVHAYSLVHDDLPCMDDDDLRRGQPTVHVKWDEATAVLAGDALQTSPSSCWRAATGPARTARLALVFTLAGAGGGAAWCWARRSTWPPSGGDPAPTLDDDHAAAGNKTGALIAGRAGGRRARPRRPGPADDLCQAIGLAFQIADDILDVEGDAVRPASASARTPVPARRPSCRCWAGGARRARGDLVEERARRWPFAATGPMLCAGRPLM